MVTKLMESSLSSKLQFYDLHDKNGAVLPSPIEGITCGIRIDVSASLLPNVFLKLGNELLPLFERESKVHAEWPPRASGHYELFLECEIAREHQTISVMPRYFSQEECEFLIRDLGEVLPNTIVTRLNLCGADLVALPASDGESTIQAEYRRIRHAIAGTKESLGLLQILPMLQRNCQKVLLPKLELRSINKLRRPEMSRLPQAMSIPGNLVTIDRLYQMYDQTVQSSFGAYENRLVKAYVLALRGRLSMLQARLTQEQAPPAMATELTTLANEFHLTYMRAEFLRSVPALSTVRVTMVLLKNPAYRAVLEGYLALNEPSSVTIQEPALSFPLNRFPYLYQRWVNLQLLSALLQVCAERGYKCVTHRWVKRSIKSTKIQVTNDDQPAVQLSNVASGRNVSFVPWSGSVSASGQRGPIDAAIVIETPGKPLAVLVFDPKYWVDSEVVKTKSESVKKTSENVKRTSENARVKKRKKKGAKNKAEEGEVAEAAEGTEETEEADAVSVIKPRAEDVEEILRAEDQLKALGGATELQYAAILYPGPRTQLAANVEALPAHPNSVDVLQANLCEVLRRFL